MLDEFSRSRLLLGRRAMEKLWHSRVVVFGLGGVGGHAVDALARTGIGSFVLVDADTVSLTNINRQLIADHTTVGKRKTDVMQEHIARIHPEIKVEVHPDFILPGVEMPYLDSCDYIVDAIDTVSAKLYLAEEGFRRGIPVISSMGAGNKLDPTRFRVADIYETSVCPLCRVMRRELRKRGIPSMKVVYSTEEPVPREENAELEAESQKRSTPGSVAFVPSVAGLILASQVIRELTEGLRPAAR